MTNLVGFSQCLCKWDVVPFNLQHYLTDFYCNFIIASEMHPIIICIAFLPKQCRLDFEYNKHIVTVAITNVYGNLTHSPNLHDLFKF